jgi:chromosome segregation ATPase
MRSLRSFALAASTRFFVVLSLVFVFSLSESVLGQQSQDPKKKSPRLTTDDVVRSKPTVEVVDETSEEASGAKAGEEARAGAKPADASKPPAKSDTATKADPDLAAWRERVEQARERVKEAQREAEEGELRVTQLRNQLGGSGGTAKHRNETAAELEESGSRLRELRAEARTAEADLKELLEQGREKSFTEAPPAKATSESGEANQDYYKAKYAELNEKIQTADRQIQLYGNRIRELSERMNNPNVDRFSASQLQQDRDEANQKLQEAHEARTKAQNELDELQNEARRAGLPPGVFR